MMELVCPAGTPAALRAAVDAGAHTVYCGFADETNARNFPGLNFSRDELAAGVAYATARQRARQVRAMFAQYVPPAVVQRRIAQPRHQRGEGRLVQQLAARAGQRRGHQQRERHAARRERIPRKPLEQGRQPHRHAHRHDPVIGRAPRTDLAHQIVMQREGDDRADDGKIGRSRPELPRARHRRRRSPCRWSSGPGPVRSRQRTRSGPGRRPRSARSRCRS